jgi:succinate dehydrogenase / fumarate reductase flavoprotein subunit
MYHQFKQLADLDITTTPMEVGPTTHYIMGGIRVDADTQASTLPGLFAAGECAAGINGANRLGGNSLSDLIVFGKRAGEYAAKFAQENSHGTIDKEQIAEKVKWALEPFEKENGENPFALQHELQELMQLNVGIVRNEDEMQTALTSVRELKKRLENVSATGNIDFNPSWHTALDMHNLLNVSEAITLAAIERKESRGGHFREDYPNKEKQFGTINFSVKKDANGEMEIKSVPIPEMPDELKQIIEEMG